MVVVVVVVVNVAAFVVNVVVVVIWLRSEAIASESPRLIRIPQSEYLP